MKTHTIFFFSVIILSILFHHTVKGNSIQDDSNQVDSVYFLFKPHQEMPSKDAFFYAYRAYTKTMKTGTVVNKRYLTIIDFSLSSTKRRLWVLDLDSMRIAHHAFVAHGRNSGLEYATEFSNVLTSKKSSIGVFLTGKTYHGRHGLSLKLSGLENGINHNASQRYIVIHGASYVTKQFITKYGRAGRSYGCPALPPQKTAAIIDTIKEKSVLFAYYPIDSYFKKSLFFSSDN